jgi:hypothetical protein
VFTVRYALSPYIKQIRFIFKGLAIVRTQQNRGYWNLKEKAQDALWTSRFGRGYGPVAREITH